MDKTFDNLLSYLEDEVERRKKTEKTMRVLAKDGIINETTFLVVCIQVDDLNHLLGKIKEEFGVS